MALVITLTVGIGMIFYECFWAKGHRDSYNALNLALGALFFRSCLPDIATSADTHEHLNPPPLAPMEEDVEKGKEGKKEEGKKEEGHHHE